VADARQELLSAVPVIYQIPPLGDFAHGRLEYNAIQSEALHPALPPVRRSLEDLGELGFRDPVTPACLSEYFSAYATIV
jgi:hypothetical protein